MLSEKIDDQEQYSSRSCLVFEGLNNMDEDNKNLSQEIVNIVRYQLNVKISGNDIDKSHSIKKNQRKQEQSKIYKTFNGRDNLKTSSEIDKNKKDKTNQPIKTKVSLTKRRQKLLEYVTKLTDDYSLIHFVYTDINGNLKIRLKESIKNWATFSFNNKMELAEILGLVKHFEYHTKFSEAKNQSNCENESSFICLFIFSLLFPPLHSFSVVCEKDSDYY